VRNLYNKYTSKRRTKGRNGEEIEIKEGGWGKIWLCSANFSTIKMSLSSHCKAKKKKQTKV
jgi:hypothetical protein